MAIRNLSQTEFEQVLSAHLRPSRPVDTTELLFGRAMALERMTEAYASLGRQVFVYGDRGVGKTSLAKTAAYNLNPAESDPVYVMWGVGTTFQSLMSDIYVQLIGTERIGAKKTTSTTGLNLKAVHAHKTVEKHEGGVPKISDVNSAISALRAACPSGAARRVIILDEFDLVESEVDKAMFAQLIKQLGDQEVNACFVFVGIGRSLDELLSSHNSCYRYLEAVILDRLDFSGRWEIIDACSAALNITVNDDSRLRVAQISDGFPHYVHLVSEKLFWAAFRDEQTVTTISPDHYQVAIRNAVLSIEPHLRQAYDTAIKKYKDDYEEVLWAVADHYELLRNTESIYGSYRRVMDLLDKEPMERYALSQRLNSLKSPMCGRILVSPRRSWFEFRESVVRGYVRLRAEDKSIRLALEHESAKDPPPSRPSRKPVRAPR